MRAAGLVTNTRGLREHDHCCWIFDDPAEFRHHAIEFLAEGIRLGLRALYVGPRTTGELRADLQGLDGASELLAGGSLRLSSLAETYAAGAFVDPDEQVSEFARATTEALADGYAGLRVAADATALVETPEQLEAFTRYEHLVDRYMAEHPFSAMCAYERRGTAGDLAGELACLHPVAVAEFTSFQVFMADADILAIRGELDVSCEELFERTLRRADPGRCGDVVVDLSGLDFIDHRSLFVIARYAQQRGCWFTMRNEAPIVRRLVEMLDVPQLRFASPR